MSDTCVLCLERPAVTRDHTPPKCIFKWSRRCRVICGTAGLDHYRPKDFRASYLPRGLELGKRFDVGDRGLGHSPHGVGAIHYNRIDIDLIRDYNEALDHALEEAYQKAKTPKRDSYVTQRVKSGKTRDVVKDASVEEYASCNRGGRVAEW